ncbi:hypothetical protein ACMFRU_000225 [Vibrio cholerae]
MDMQVTVITNPETQLKHVEFDGLNVTYDVNTKLAKASFFTSHYAIESSLTYEFIPSALVHSINPFPLIELTDGSLNFYFSSNSDYLFFCNFLEIQADTKIFFDFSEIDSSDVKCLECVSCGCTEEAYLSNTIHGLLCSECLGGAK